MGVGPSDAPRVLSSRANRMSRRRNLSVESAEAWRPAAFESPSGVLSKLKAFARRALDLQAASLWADLKDHLASARGTVLDVGCGAQPYRGLFPPGVTYRGIDTIEAKAHFDYEVPDTSYYAGDRWPVEDGSVDFVLTSEVLEHVLKTDVFLGEALRCLRPGGRLVLTVPFSARWHYIPYDYWRFTPSDLKHVLERAGFADVSVNARGNPFVVACYKGMAICLPYLMPQASSPIARLARRAVGLVLAPPFLLMAAAAHASLRSDWGDDCLGYTASADRPA
jgi:SAM-dependent methyltransferase